MSEAASAAAGGAIAAGLGSAGPSRAQSHSGRSESKSSGFHGQNFLPGFRSTSVEEPATRVHPWVDMAMMCRQIIGAGSSAAGWIGLIVATATNDWVRTCDFSVSTCMRLDELGSRGLWVECVNNPAMPHCVPLNPILNLPAYVQTSRALMVISCLLGMAAMLLVLLSLTCIRLQNDNAVIKQRRALAGGVLFLVMAVCGIVSTVWFPVGAHQSGGLMSFGFSLYAGWVGSALCLLGGLTILLCRVVMSARPDRENSFYYSRQGGTAVPLDTPANHGKSARV